ncbi:pectinesterase family protein [Mucilaginibacter sp. PAMB04274]|uniref:pectinesterase family protein n=1 Tax=Mucilaginibacter sp. PAMB04274 TaxID=3138568 RepID=UPI0031F71BC2
MKQLAFIIGLLAMGIAHSFGQPKAKLPVVVDAAGKGQFKTIQAAINSLPDSATADRVILIKNGTYNEKLFITKNHIVLKGESEKGVVITQDIARDIWRCQGNADDWGVATMNLRGSDITLQNLSVINGYGFHHKADTIVSCQVGSEPATQKAVKNTGHQMALRSFQTTRLKVLNCTFRALGGDTVSPWNAASGLFYFKDCTMEGGVDFYCPRGWAYAEGCTFICHSKEAAIWHDGSGNPDQKTVLVNCTFKGDEGFKLGRYHRESQFYLINCSFAATMANAPVFQAASSTGVKWGERVYYYNCHRTGGDFAWFANNLNKAKTAPVASQINAQWALDQQWNPMLN